MRCCAGSAQYIRNPGNTVLDRVDYTASTRRHDELLSHLVQNRSLSALKGGDHEVEIDDLSYV